VRCSPSGRAVATYRAESFLLSPQNQTSSSVSSVPGKKTPGGLPSVCSAHRRLASSQQASRSLSSHSGTVPVLSDRLHLASMSASAHQLRAICIQADGTERTPLFTCRASLRCQFFESLANGKAQQRTLMSIRSNGNERQPDWWLAHSLNQKSHGRGNERTAQRIFSDWCQPASYQLRRKQRPHQENDGTSSLLVCPPISFLQWTSFSMSEATGQEKNGKYSRESATRRGMRQENLRLASVAAEPATSQKRRVRL